MRWNVVNYFFHRIHRFHRISYIILPQKSMRWIFVRNAVNFCKKCGEIFIFTAFTAITAFLTKIYPKISTRVTHKQKFNNIVLSIRTKACSSSCSWFNSFIIKLINPDTWWYDTLWKCDYFTAEFTFCILVYMSSHAHFCTVRFVRTLWAIAAECCNTLFGHTKSYKILLKTFLIKWR